MYLKHSSDTPLASGYNDHLIEYPPGWGRGHYHHYYDEGDRDGTMIEWYEDEQDHVDTMTGAYHHQYN